ncbi:MAG: NAD(P)H-hydrate dehydratase [Sphingomonas sp.]|uniref:NAD(P)H-hydrate dehydratase n=1 Tax=Sphingomonas sp. TaxID=28214 RepID=UPI0025D730C9|nr:NAD(P)H-hydrate dehydratase [Sphingomonas sp.]MBX9882128.1 NAD(P)H-hydrate dehydratase [Sphingomonas sp.]
MTPLAGRPILTAAEMRAAESTAIDAGTSVETLMARAGEAVGAWVRRLSGAEVLILCGSGNNGGDGYVAARWLAERGQRVRVGASAPPRTAAAQAARAAWGGPVEPIEAVAPAPVLVDALFGTGLTRGLDPALAARLAELAAAASYRIAVDLPSGVASDDGTLLSPLPRFELTLALGALKPAHLLQPAADKCGAVRLVPIGVDATSEAHVLAPPAPVRLGPTDHKYTRGLVAIIAGAMPGAARLAGEAALRGGAGYALLLGGEGGPAALVARPYAPEALADRRIGVLVVGPGLGRDDRARAKLADALASPHRLLLDGDALHLVAPERLAGRTSPVILTPHQGEFAAMFGDMPGSKLDRARAAARRVGAVVVLKGADTVIAAPDGRAALTETGVPWLATAGTGDVLAGAIAAALAHGGDSFAAAQAGVWRHAAAARLLGPGMIADDLARALSEVGP